MHTSMASMRPVQPLLATSLHLAPRFPPIRAREYCIAHSNPSRKHTLLVVDGPVDQEPTSTLPSPKKKKKKKNNNNNNSEATPQVENPNFSTKVSDQGKWLLSQSSHVPRSPLDLREIVAENDGSSLAATICNIVDGLISAYLDPPMLKPSIDPKVQLSGNFAPVPEVSPQRCMVVDGVLPPELNGGVYIRNGPNAATVNPTGGFHVFDGDGMLHAVSFKDGVATYCARYVKTNRFMQEAMVGRPMVAKFFGGCLGVAGFARLMLFVARVALGLVDITKGWGLANTSVAYFNGKILAMSEDDMPYMVRVTDEGEIETEGKWSFSQGDDNNKFSMCAHPKFDEETGEMFAFGLNRAIVGFSPRFTYFSVSASGTKSEDFLLPYWGYIPLIHDFAITRNYVIFPDNQFIMMPVGMATGGEPLVCDKGKVSRLGLLPRQDVNETKMQWFDLPECNCFHYVNAWEEGDQVVIITSVISPPELFLEVPAPEALECVLTEVRLDTSTGLASRRAICNGCLEFGTFDHRRTGKRSRFVHMSSGRYPHLTGIVKVDVTITDSERAIVGRRDYGPSCYGSEPFFVPRNPSSSQDEDDEDEDRGYLLAFVHNEKRESTDLLVMDAKTPSLDVVARVKIPSRVPYGFHGCFINKDQLANYHP